MKIKFYLLLLFTLLTLNTPLPSSEQNSQPVNVELLSETNAVQLGRPFWVGIRMTLAEGWHSYWKNPGESGFPVSVEWKLPPGYTAGPLMWPAPKRFDTQSLIGYGYEGEVWIMALITPPANESPSSTADLAANVKWLSCSDSACLPGFAEVKASLPIEHDEPAFNEAIASGFATARQKLPQPLATEIVAQKKDHFIEISLGLLSAPFKQAYFCPEEKDLFDEKTEAVVINDATEAGFSVLLKTLDLDKAEPQRLKGVLVLTGEKPDDIIHAVDLNIAVNNAGPSRKLLSYVDIPRVAGMADIALGMETPRPYTFEGSILFYLFTAFVGGIILNLMPCVLPVISFKILSFVKMSGKSRKTTFKHGAAFSLGVLASFWALAIGLMILQAYGHSVGWGFQLQEPLFVAVLTTVLLVFALSLFGVFEMGTLFASWAGKGTTKGSGEVSLFNSFFSGVLATAVATPCTGPFLGPAVGFAVTQPPLLALLVFTSLGLGMASPYLILSGFPSLLRFIPKPGPWMVTFKEITGFIMFATVLWLLWVFGAQTDSLALFLLMSGLFVAGLGCWILGKWGSISRRRFIRIVGNVVAIACFIIAADVIYTAATPPIDTLEEIRPLSLEGHHPTGAWEPFSLERLKELQAKGIPVFVDFTARWCLICQANHLVLSVDHLDKKMTELGVVKMKADWTKHDPVITEQLKKYGRNGVPLYLFYDGKNDEPEILPQVLTPDTVLTTLNKIQSKPLADGKEL